MPCINILAHLYRWVQRSCSSALAGSGERPWAGPSGWVPGRLMDGARPPRPTEFYLRLTSRCCCGCSARSASLINLSLSPPLGSISLLQLSLHSPPPPLLPCPQMPPTASLPAHLRLQVSHRSLPRPFLLIGLTNKVEGKHPHRYTHAHTHTCLQHDRLGGLTGVACHLLV